MACRVLMCSCLVCCFKQKTAYEMRISDWSSDVCSSDLYRYPADEAERRRLEDEARKRAAEAGYADQVLKIHEQYGPRNWRYSAQGSAAIEPQAVYDNGKVTTFAFSGNQEMPAIYIENYDGTESLVPNTAQGDPVLVHTNSTKLNHPR